MAILPKPPTMENIMATMETFVADKWLELAKGKELFSKADKAGVPIRVVHPNGNFKVIRNADKLPETVATTSQSYQGGRSR
jgi:hypothetical protein